MLLRLMLRVVIISPLPPENHGESVYTTNLIEHLIENPHLEILAIGGIESQPLQFASDRLTTCNIWRQRNLNYPFTLLEVIRKFNPHLVHVQFGPYGDLFGGFFGEPMLLLLLLLRMSGIQTTITLHSTWMPEQVAERVRTYRFLGKISFLGSVFFRLYMKILDWGTTTVQLSTVKLDSLLRKKFLQEYLFDPEKVQEIPHPFSPIANEISRELAEKELSVLGKKVVLIFGFIRPGKGIEIAIEAINHVRESVPDVLLLIAGRPIDSRGERYLEQLNAQVKKLELEHHVRFDTTHIPDDVVPFYISAASVLLIPYTESVGASGPIHNYAGYGIPIIAADVGYHMQETLDGMLTLFETQNTEDLTKKLIPLLTKESLRNKIIHNQVAYTKQRSWVRAANLTLKNYMMVLTKT